MMTVSSTSSNIDEALQTVLDQTVDDIEVIVVVPPDVEASLRHLEDPRVRVYQRSVEEGSNHQRPVIHGEYVAYADGSVRWSPDYLHRALAEFDQEKLLVRVSWNWQKMSGQEVEAVAAAHRRFGIPPAMCIQPMAVAWHAVVQRREALGPDVDLLAADHDSLELAMGMTELRSSERVAVISSPLLSVLVPDTQVAHLSSRAVRARVYFGSVWRRAIDEGLLRWSVVPGGGLRPKWWAPELYPDRWLAPRSRLWMEATEPISSVTFDWHLGQHAEPVHIEVSVNGTVYHRDCHERTLSWTLPCTADSGDDVIVGIVVEPPTRPRDWNSSDRRDLGLVLTGISGSSVTSSESDSSRFALTLPPEDSPSAILGSVVLSYRRPELLYRTLDSYVMATKVPHELVIVDGGSNPETQSIIELFCTNYPNVRAVLLEENVGGVGFDIGADLCDTPYIHFFGDDIEYLEGWDREAIAVMETFPEIGQFGLHFRAQPQDIPMIRRHGRAAHVYPIGTTEGTSVVRESVRDLGIRWGNVPDQGTGLKLPADGNYSASIQRAGFLVASPEQPLIQHIGAGQDEMTLRPDYYARNLAVKLRDGYKPA